MSKQNWILLAVTLALIGGGAGYLGYFRTHQTLGRPGVKTKPLPDDKRVEVLLPEQVLDYASTNLPVDDVTVATLPPDTSFGQRIYQAPDGFWLQLNVVLMGADRTSLHKPQFCLDSQGWHIDETAVRTNVPLACYPFSLPVVELRATKERNGQPVPQRAIYVYWYVADGAVSASTTGFQRMFWMGWDLLRTGVLQRWAYVSCLAVCSPGQEEATAERIKKFIAGSAPGMYLPPNRAQAQDSPSPKPAAAAHPY